MKIKYFALMFLGLCSFSVFGCPTDGSNTGTVTGDIVGIEVRENCTYIFIENVITSLPVIDSNPFTPGRFKYLALDPNNNPAYKSMLTVATMGFAAGKKVYANVTSRLARVNYLSVSDAENSNQ